MVMIKLPVLRFTKPTDLEKNGGGKRWQDLLGVACTAPSPSARPTATWWAASMCRASAASASRPVRSRSPCLRTAGSPTHWFAAPHCPRGAPCVLPFLGEVEVEEQIEHQPTRGGDSSFHADLDSFTRQKRLAAKDAALRELNKGNEVKPLPKAQPAGFNPDGTGSFTTRKADRFPSSGTIHSSAWMKAGLPS